MALFTLTPSVRILLITAQSLRVYQKGKDQLILEGTFSADDFGLAGFDRYLSSSPESLVHLVVDLSEEDFRVEAIAHVGGKDRKVLLERKLQQFFRGSEYRAARLQERESDGRRDDRVLFSALTHPELLAPWIDCLLKRKVRIKGIVSVPLLMELFSSALQLDSVPHLLLVTLEEKVGLRQTYLQKGRLKFSRLLAVTGSEDLADTFLAECRHIRQYLERLKLLPHDQPLQAHICTSADRVEGFSGNLASTPLLPFQFHDTEMIGAELGIDPLSLQNHGVVYLSLLRALQIKKLDNVYAPPPVTRHHRLQLIRQGLIIITLLVAVVALVAGGLLLQEGFTTIQGKQGFDRETLRFQMRLEELQQTFPQSPVPATEMRNLVETVERVRSQEILPMRTMAMISRAMLLFPTIRVQEFEWRLSSLTPLNEASTAMPTSGVGSESLGGQAPVPVILPPLLEGKTMSISILNGMVVPSQGYGKAQKSIEAFIATLETIPGIQVSPLAMPTDTQPNATIQAKLDDHDIVAKFSLKIEYRAVRQ